MALVVKVDEDLPASLAKLLEMRDYTVRTVCGQGWGGTKDPILWPLIKAEDAFFVTADKGFGDLRTFPPGTHGGILVLRPGRESVSRFLALVEAVLAKRSLDSLAGTVAVATPKGLRVRRKPL